MEREEKPFKQQKNSSFMFKALFAFIGFGLTALGIWLLSPIIAGTGIIFLVFVIWWIRSTRSV